MILSYARQFGKPVLNFFLVLLFLLLVVRPAVLAMIRPRLAEQAEPDAQALLEGEERMALEEAEAVETEAIIAQRRLDNLKEHTAELLQKNMEQSINVLKIWLKEENA